PRCRPLVWRRRRRRRPTLRPYPTLFRSAVGLPVAAHPAVGCATRLDPPPIEVAPLGDVTEADGVRRLGRGWARRRGAILEVRLAGSPEAIGQQMGRLLHPEMVAIEDELLGQFAHFVPFAPVRALLVDL